MAASTIALFGHGSIENIARIIGELYTGPELTRILASVGMPDPLGEGQTKWKRLATSMQEKQVSQRDGRPILAVITAAMKPDMIWDRQAKAVVARDELTQVLSLSGYRVLDDGRIGRAKTATTASEASARSERLRKLLEARHAHPEVIRHCREELLRKDHYEAVFEAVKGLGARLREKSGLDEDGPVLVFRPARSRASRIAASATASGASPSSANPTSLCTNTWRCCPPPPPGSPTGEQGRRGNAGPQAAARTRPARGQRDHQVRAIIPSRRRGLDFVRRSP